MNSKADSTFDKNASAEPQLAEQWPVLQRLRYGLQQLNTPWPASVKGLFRQEQWLQRLDVCPNAMSLQTLDNSQTLQNAVDAAPCTEQVLLEALEAQVRWRHSGRTATSEAGTAEREIQIPVAPGKVQDSVLGNATNTAAVHKVPAESTGQGDAQPGPDNATPLAPEFMRAWIDEILAQSQQPDKTQSERACRANRQADGVAEQNAVPRGSAKKGSAKKSVAKRHADAQLVNSAKTQGSTNSGTSENSGARESRHAKVRYLSEKAPKSGTPDNFQPQQTGRFSIPVPEVADKKTVASSDSMSAILSSQSIPQGMVLLQQLVDLSRNSESHTAAKPSSNASRLTTNNGNNFIGQAAQKSTRAAFEKNSGFPSAFGEHVSQTVTQPENRNTLFNESEKHRPVLQQEPDHLAELVNEALIEQALRNGVDLS